jgi:hypothetical protein
MMLSVQKKKKKETFNFAVFGVTAALLLSQLEASPLFWNEQKINQSYQTEFTAR